MNSAVTQMLNKYRGESFGEKEQALREVLQELTLLGLWRTKFFEHAAFYGGTALRILYGLDRFSEDLDFTLLVPDPKFSWKPYAQGVESELAAFGFEVSMEEKNKTADTTIRSAFLKANTLQEMLRIGVKGDRLKGVHPETLIRIKVEIDTDPTVTYGIESKFLTDPIPATVRSVKETDMFAGKMHAALFRAWRGRVKGRDWYDALWFVRRATPLNLELFSRMMGQTHSMSALQFQTLLNEKIATLDLASAKADIMPFVRREYHQSIEEVWSREFFSQTLSHIHFC